MKNKRIALFIILAMLVFSSQVFATETKSKEIKLNFNAVTEQQKSSVAKVEKMLNDAWNDIKSTYNINDSGYTLLNISDMPAFADGQIPGFEGQENIKKVMDVVFHKLYVLSEVPYKSTQPVILINSKMDDVIICYKLDNGNNIIKKAVLENGIWKIYDDEKPGKPVLKIEDMK